MLPKKVYYAPPVLNWKGGTQGTEKSDRLSEVGHYISLP